MFILENTVCKLQNNFVEFIEFNEFFCDDHIYVRDMHTVFPVQETGKNIHNDFNCRQCILRT
jgi:hypothetical protein